MPCWTRRTTTVELAAADPEVLRRGLLAAEFTITAESDGVLAVNSRDGRGATIARGQVRVLRGDECVINEIKRAYSQEVVKSAAKRFGYTITTNKQTGKITAGRRF
jgi:hypothetical protein